VAHRTWLGYEHGFTHQVVDLVEAIGNDVQPEPSFSDALQVQRVLAAVERSAEDGLRAYSIRTSRAFDSL